MSDGFSWLVWYSTLFEDIPTAGIVKAEASEAKVRSGNRHQRHQTPTCRCLAGFPILMLARLLACRSIQTHD